MGGPGARRILIVDDEEGIRVLCRVNLELAGFDVIEASDGGPVAELARTERPDVIFLDLMMPVKDGWEALSDLKADPETADIPVILLTARTSEEDQLRGWAGGIFEFLPKPFNPQALVECATQALEPMAPADAEARRRRTIEQLELIQQFRKR